MATLQENVTRVTDALSDVRAAITEKGGTGAVAAEGLGPAIRALPSGSGQPKNALAEIFFTDAAVSGGQTSAASWTSHKITADCVPEGAQTFMPYLHFYAYPSTQIKEIDLRGTGVCKFPAACFRSTKIQRIWLDTANIGWYMASSGIFQYTNVLEYADLGYTDYLGQLCFSSAPILKVVVLRRPTKVATLNNVNCFEHCGSLQHIYVPPALVESYKTATNWTEYAEKIEAIPEGYDIGSEPLKDEGSIWG